MEQAELLKRIDELEREIALLPRGSVAVKRINDKEYYYHRINENGKRRETYVDFDDVDELRAQIKKRKALEKELKEVLNCEVENFLFVQAFAITLIMTNFAFDYKITLIIFNMKKAFLSLALLLSALVANATVRLPKIFSDNMVIQRNAEIRIWVLLYSGIILINTWLSGVEKSK